MNKDEINTLRKGFDIPVGGNIIIHKLGGFLVKTKQQRQ